MIPIITKIAGVLTGGKGELVKNIGGVLDNLITSKEEKDAAILAIEQEVNRHEEKTMEHITKMAEIEGKDMDSARNREIQIATSEKAPLINKIIQPILALLLLGSCFVMWYTILFKDVPKEKEIIVAGIVGSLTTIAMGVVGYYFGSSAGSKSKQEQIDRLTK